MAIEIDDSLPLYVCRICLVTAQFIESKLHGICEVAQESFRKLQVQGSKHPKDSTGVGASPYSQKRLLRLQIWSTIKDTRGDNTSTMLPDLLPVNLKKNGNTSLQTDFETSR